VRQKLWSLHLRLKFQKWDPRMLLAVEHDPLGNRMGRPIPFEVSVLQPESRGFTA
jgi:hypothetical protein